MTLRAVGLSGFSSSNQDGKFVIDDALMTSEAATRTNRGSLCWADIRFLDDAFRKASAPPNQISNIAYLRDSNLQASAGRHLFSILTGRHIYTGPGQLLVKETGNKDYDIIAKKPRLVFKGGMSFPNGQSLFGYQVDSEYGKFCKGWKPYLEGYSGALLSKLGISEVLKRYRDKIYKSTLCPIDRNDAFAVCVLQAWTNTLLGLSSATSFDGTFYDFPDGVTPPNWARKDLCRQMLLDYARTFLTGFASAFGLSPSYGNNAFPGIP